MWSVGVSEIHKKYFISCIQFTWEQIYYVILSNRNMQYHLNKADKQ